MHFPGTVLNDQFGGDGAWEANLAQLEARTPVIEAIGITDYYSLDTYERLQVSKAAGRLSDCGFIFPNIEMRLAFGTVKGQWVSHHFTQNVNVHGIQHPQEVADAIKVSARRGGQDFIRNVQGTIT